MRVSGIIGSYHPWGIPSFPQKVDKDSMITLLDKAEIANQVANCKPKASELNLAFQSNHKSLPRPIPKLWNGRGVLNATFWDRFNKLPLPILSDKRPKLLSILNQKALAAGMSNESFVSSPNQTMDSGPHRWSSSEQPSSQPWSAEAQEINSASIPKPPKVIELPDAVISAEFEVIIPNEKGLKNRLEMQEEIGEVLETNLEKVMGEGALIGSGVSCDVIKYKLKIDLGPLSKGSFVAVKRFKRRARRGNDDNYFNEMYNLWKLRNVDSVIRSVLHKRRFYNALMSLVDISLVKSCCHKTSKKPFHYKQIISSNIADSIMGKTEIHLRNLPDRG